MAVTITQTADPAGATVSSDVATYNTTAIGTAAADRVVVVIVHVERAARATVTIDSGGGAVAMTERTSLAQASLTGCYIFTRSVPTGTTANIVVTFTGGSSVTNDRHRINVYSVTGSDGSTFTVAEDTSLDMDSTDPLSSGSVTIPSNGALLAAACGGTDTDAKTWANATEDLDGDAGLLRYTTATRTTSGSVTVTCTGTSNGEDGHLAVIIFSPQANVDLSPGAADLVLSPTAPTATVDVRRDPAAADLVLSPTAPTADRTALVSLQPATADLVLSPTAPSAVRTAFTFLHQIGCRLRLDVLAVDTPGPTWAAAQNGTIPLFADTLYRIRFLVQEVSGIGATVGMKLQYKKNAGAKTDVTTSSSNVQAADASASADDAAITISRLTGGSGSFANGVYDETGSFPQSAASAITASGYTEVEFGFKIVEADTVSNDTIIFYLEISEDSSGIVVLSNEVATIHSIKENIAISPGSGNLLLDATAPSATITGGVSMDISPGAGDLVLSSEAPTLLIDERRDPAAADLVLSPTAPTLDIVYSFSPASADLVLSTFAPERVTDERRDPAQGNLTLTTEAPTNEQTTPISPPAADLTLSSDAPTVYRDFRCDPAAADLVLSPTAPTAVTTILRDPGTADLTLTTEAPTVLIDVRRDPAAGDLVLSTFAPERVTDVRRDPESGDLVLSPTAPTAKIAFGFEPATADLVLTTFRPLLELSITEPTPIRRPLYRVGGRAGVYWPGRRA